MGFCEADRAYLVGVSQYLRKKYRKLDELYRLTKELQDATQRNDHTSIQMILSMRLEEMIAVDGLDGEYEKSLASFSPEGRKTLLRILKKEAFSSEVPEEQNLRKQYEALLHVLQRIQTLDQAMSQKIAGSHSYYVTQSPL